MPKCLIFVWKVIIVISQDYPHALLKTIITLNYTMHKYKCKQSVNAFRKIPSIMIFNRFRIIGQ